MDTRRHVRLFRNGANQAVRIPRELELPGNDAIISREGDALVIRPVKPRSLLALLRTLTPLQDDFSEIVDRPADAVEL